MHHLTLIWATRTVSPLDSIYDRPPGIFSAANHGYAPISFFYKLGTLNLNPHLQ